MPHNLKPRPGEHIGGGFFVVRRHTSSGRMTVCKNGMPFEHPTFESAATEAIRLAELQPGKPFCVMAQLGDAIVAAAQEKVEEPVAG